MGAESEGRLRVIAEGAAEVAEQLDRVADSSEKVADGTEHVSEKSRAATVSLGELRGALAATGMAAAVLQLKAWADQNDRLNDILEQTGGSLSLASRATQGLVRDMDLARARGELLAAGVTVTDQQFAAIAASANVYALRMGKDVPQALEQLTGALVTGSERGLRPFGIALEDGARGAEGTRQALEQMSREAEHNEAAIRRSIGGLDRLEHATNVAKDALVTLYGGTINHVLDGLGKLGETAGRTAAALSAGDANGLARALMESSQEAGDFADKIPLVGAALRAQIGAVRDFTSELLGFRAAARTAAMLPVPGTLDLFDDEASDVVGDDDEDAWGARTGARPVRLQTTRRRRGGGGGGGHRGDDRWEISRQEVERIARDEAERAAALERAARDEARDAFFGMSTQTSEALRAGIGDNQRPAFNAERRGGTGRQPLGGERNASQQVSAMARSTDSAVKYADALGRLGEVGSTALGALTNAVTANVEAWVSGEKTIGQALLGILSQTLSTIAKESAVKAVLYTAEGFAALVTGNVPASTSAFTAAGLYTAAAAAAGIGSAVVSAATSGGGSHGRSRYQGGSAAVSAHSGAVSDGGGGGVSIHYHVAPGAMIGEQRRTEDRLVRMTREGARRAARVQNRPEPRL